jgi:hypothetical protein
VQKCVNLIKQICCECADMYISLYLYFHLMTLGTLIHLLYLYLNFNSKNLKYYLTLRYHSAFKNLKKELDFWIHFLWLKNTVLNTDVFDVLLAVQT